MRRRGEGNGEGPRESGGPTWRRARVVRDMRRVVACRAEGMWGRGAAEGDKARMLTTGSATDRDE